MERRSTDFFWHTFLPQFCGSEELFRSHCMDKRIVEHWKMPPGAVAAVLMLAVISFATGASGSCFPPPPNLVGWWPGDGNARDIQGTNNGTLQGGATATAAGMVAQAFSFDGTNSFVQIPDSPALRPTNLTIEAWVRFNSLDSAGSGGSRAGDQYIVFKQNTRTTDFEGFDLSKTRVAGGDVFRFLVTSATAQTAEIHSATLLTTGVWFHVVAVRGSNFTQIYVNGNLERQTNVSFAQNYGTLPLYLGTSGQSIWDHKLKGMLDEVSLYNRALSSNEVAAIYAAGAAGKCKAGGGLSITTQPQTQSVAAGSNPLFTVAATGTAPLSYQWRFNGGVIAGATNTSLALTNVQPADGGSYTVVVTNSAASATSAVAVLTVLLPPAITTQPQSRTNLTGTTASFSATATGSTPLGYQWQFNGASLANGGRVSGAKTNTLSVTNAQPADAGSYTVVVSNAAGVVTSAVAVLTITGPPVITAQPASQSVVVGANASFGLTASGTPPLAYQWLFGNTPITDATNANLALSNVQPANAGNYSVVVTNPVGSATSAVAVLTVLVPPVITAQPQSQTNVAGTTVAFSAGASGSAPLSYQWQLNTVNLVNGGRVSGARTNTLSVTNVQPADAGSYLLVVTNAAGVAASAVATLTVISPPAITAQPIGQSVSAGSNTSFSVTASGTLPLGYQWRGNGTNLADGSQFSGSASPTLSILNVQATNAGGYSVVVTNIAGAVTSAVAGLTVIVPGSCVPPLPGLIGWWPGDGNAGDIAGTDNGALQGGATANATGMVAQALRFDGTNSYVQIPDSPILRPTNLTIEAWVRFSSLNSAGSGGSPAGDQYIVFKQNTRSGDFEGFDLSKTRVAGGDVFRFLVTSATAQSAGVHSTTLLTTGVWYHVAAMRGSNFTRLYVNGRLEGQTNVTFAQNYGTLPLFFGTSGQSYWDHKLNGLLDEASLYNRALSSNEVAAIYAAGAAGKCKAVVGASIITPPQSQSVAAGNSVTFTVTAAGSAPLSYQWRFNGTNLSGATGTSLTLAAVQPANAGSYTAVVTNAAGSATSAVAVLTVLPGAGTVIINGAQTYQVIEGFGVNANSLSWTNNELRPVVDALIDQAGMTLFQAIVENSNWEATNDNSNADVMNWTYYNTLYSAPDFQKLWGMMAYLNQRGITNGLVPKTGGPAPLWMGGLSLTSGRENEYAEMLVSMLIYARNTQHLQFTEARLVNEPDITYSGVHLSGSAQYVAVMRDIAQQLDTNGMSDVRFSGPELANTSTAWMTAMMGDPYLMSKVAHFGLHSYLNQTPDATGVHNFIQQSAYPGRPFWMTEFNVWCQSCLDGVSGDNSWAYARGTATVLLNLLAQGAAAGIVFEAWDSQYYGYDAATGLSKPLAWSYWGLFAVDNINAAVRTYTPRKGFYTFAQIAKFVRPGAQRIDVSGASTPLTVLAFYNTNSGQFTLTGANTTSSAATLSCALTSLPVIPSLDLYYTSSTTNLSQGAHVTVNNGSFSVVVPADCVFTLTYTNPVAGQPAPPMITQQPQSQAVMTASNAVFTVTASGTAPLSYQWLVNGTNLANGGNVSGATGAALTLVNVQASDAGNYAAVVTNSAGSVTSAVAVLTVLVPSNPPAWETSDIGPVWSDNFNRASLGGNWVILGSANASIVNNELRFVQTDQNSARQVYYQPWLTSSDQWTLRWSQRFGTLDAGSVGVGVGLKNFQAAGGNDRGYNALLYGAGANRGKMALERWDGTTQNLVTMGSPLTLAAGDIVDCWLTRSGWTITATASNRANAQVSTTSLVFSDFVTPRLEAPTISRMCFYPLQGTVYVSNLSFAINQRKPARFVVIGASIAEGYDASTYARGFVRVVQSNVTEVVCNDSSSYNTTGDALSILPEILAHQPGTAILTVGANDLTFGYPASQWQGNYSSLVTQLQANGVKVKHCLPTPETTTDQRPLRTWLLATYPTSDIIDHWTLLVANSYQLNPAYDNYDHDGVHPIDAGQLLMGQIILTNLFGSLAKSQAIPMAAPSPRFTPVTLLPDRTFLVLFDAVSNPTYQIDASTDLVNWTVLTNLPNPNGTLQFIDTDAINFTQRFYRAKLLP